MVRDEIVAYLEAYAATHAAGEIREGVAVNRLSPGAGVPAPRHVRRTHRRRRRRGLHRRLPTYPHRPAVADELPPDLTLRDATAYRNPDGLPDGPVPVVGSGQTGIQLAEELHLAGRDVVLSCGRAPWGPRRPGGIDIVTWLVRVGFYEQPRTSLPGP